MTLAIMGFSIGMGWFARRANRERAKAEQQQLRAEQESKFLSGLFQSATPDAERGKTITARDVLDLSVKRIDRELAGQPDVRASMLDSIGSSYVALGLYDQAQPLQEQAYSIRKKEFGNDNLDVAQSATSLALVMRAQGKFDQEEALLREALAVRQKLVGENNPLVGETLANLGECLYLQSRTQEAEPLLRKAIAVSRENSDVIAGARNYLALVLEKKGSYQEATRLLRSAAEISAGNEGTDSPSYLTAMHNLAGALSDLGNLSEAEATERKVLEIRQRVSGRDHPDTAYSLNMLGWILLEKGDWAAAEPYLKESLEIVRKTLGTKNPRLAVSLNNWARVLQGEETTKKPKITTGRRLLCCRKIGPPKVGRLQKSRPILVFCNSTAATVRVRNVTLSRRLICVESLAAITTPKLLPRFSTWDWPGRFREISRGPRLYSAKP